MKVEWERFKVYEDGSQSNWSNGTITLGDRKYEVSIVDHTREDQKQEDKKYRRKVSHAYEVSGLPLYIRTECFYKVGFENYPAASSVGIDRNPGYKDVDCHCYIGSAPEHTIEEVELLVEEAFIKAFCFDYNKEFARLKAELDKKQRLMDEALSYRELREYELANKNNQERELDLYESKEDELDR